MKLKTTGNWMSDHINTHSGGATLSLVFCLPVPITRCFPELQIRGGSKDNLKIIFLISQ